MSSTTARARRNTRSRPEARGPIGRLVLLGATALMTAVIVSTCGAIGFVGLVLPNAVRLVVGARHRPLLPLVALIGAIFMVWVDTGARTLFEPRELPVGIIVTGSEVYSGRIRDKFEPVIREKVSAFGANVLGCIFCDDHIEMLDSAIERWRDRGAKLIVMTGGMSVDPDDLTATAIRRSGAEIVTQGVPAQPGNMFCVAYLGDVAILGVPGAAIHAKTTMLDVVLPQVFTGLRFTYDELRALGAGGLCQGCAECRYPNCTFGRY